MNNNKKIKLGIEDLISERPAFLKDKRLGLLVNQASTDSHFRHSRDLVMSAYPGQLTCLLTPQHGFFCEKQDNMIESDHIHDSHTGLPVFSLYGETRKPTRQMCDHFDVLLVDLVDVGTRVYTFMSTLAYCLEAAAKWHKKIVVLDRPNPVGGEIIEGNLVDEEFFSFVGLFPIPMRHGLTLGELGLYFNDFFKIGADYQVVPMQGWKRHMLFADTGLPWVFPSPNMPTHHTAAVYPGQVIWEGTNISEGRGTTLPFELFGAPFIDSTRIHEKINYSLMPGCLLRPLIFQPTSNKWANEDCKGFQIHVTDHSVYKPYRTSLLLLQAIMKANPHDFSFKNPPYEYEFEKLPLDLIVGSQVVRKNLADGVSVLELEKAWQDKLFEFDALRRNFFLY